MTRTGRVLLDATLSVRLLASDDGGVTAVAEAGCFGRRIGGQAELEKLFGAGARISWEIDGSPAPDGMVACNGFECRLGAGTKCEVQAFLEIGD